MDRLFYTRGLARQILLSPNRVLILGSGTTDVGVGRTNTTAPQMMQLVVGDGSAFLRQIRRVLGCQCNTVDV